MGQTQLLMIVLAVIIVGIAVAVGISQLGESALAGNRDAVALDCQTAISKAHRYVEKIAREELGLVRPGELVFEFVE